MPDETPFSSSLKKEFSMGILCILTKTIGIGTFRLDMDLNSFEAVLLLSVISSGLLLILMSLGESRSSSPKTSMMYKMLNANFLVMFYISISDRVSVQNAMIAQKTPSNLAPALRISKKILCGIIYFMDIWLADIKIRY
ncbi:TPA: hypothetical protein JLY13_002657 [Escherichia coli]|nr:hypothetical protein [Escherichia coli]HAW5068612.1 hypothetical protein [Escherichia coli]